MHPHLLLAIYAAISVVCSLSGGWIPLVVHLTHRRMQNAISFVSGVVLGIGYLRAFYGVTLPGGVPLATLWIVIVLAIAIRRLPYALRAAYAALQQISVSLEEAAENLGATKARTVRRVVVPLMTGGLLAGFVTSFATASVELSATLVLAARDVDAPLSYGIYVFMQSPAGRGPGAALGVIAVVAVAICTFLAHRFAERERHRAAGRLLIAPGLTADRENRDEREGARDDDRPHPFRPCHDICSIIRPGGCAPADPRRAHSRGPTTPAPFARLTRSRSFGPPLGGGPCGVTSSP